MKKLLFSLVFVCTIISFSSAQVIFPESIAMPDDFVPQEVVMPASPLSLQVLFVGGSDFVQTTPTYGYEAGMVYAKEWHDFIGVTPDETGESLGWISVNHEQIFSDNRIGDGGGMTVFKIARAEDGSLEILDQTLDDGRAGKYFNVDFVNTVGETAMNCGGISSVVDGRIWTAEEWFRGNQNSIFFGASIDGPDSNDDFPKTPDNIDIAQGVRDTTDYIMKAGVIAPFQEGDALTKFQNFNWMVEIDPRQAVALRKQYNWGRQPFEGGAVAQDNQTIYLGPDFRGAPFSKFVADTPGDFTSGKMYVYKHDIAEKWVEIDNTTKENVLNFTSLAYAAGATIYDRIEWVAIDTTTGYVYWTETGTDNIGAREAWSDPLALGAVHDPYHTEKAIGMGLSGATDPAYPNYYGAVWCYNPVMDTNYVVIEGGPFFAESPDFANYPEKHLSNPDGLNVMYLPTDDGGLQSMLVICEDLNGRSFGRVPAGVTNSTCELYLLPLTKGSGETYSVDELIRVTAVPQGAEITGAIQTTDGNSLLVNSQHPNSDLAFPWNHSLTFAINGFENVTFTDLETPEFGDIEELEVYPNPTNQTVHFNLTSDYAIYNNNGQRLLVRRNVNQIDVSNLPAGIYYIQSAENVTKKLIIK